MSSRSQIRLCYTSSYGSYLGYESLKYLVSLRLWWFGYKFSNVVIFSAKGAEKIDVSADEAEIWDMYQNPSSLKKKDQKIVRYMKIKGKDSRGKWLQKCFAGNLVFKTVFNSGDFEVISFRFSRGWKIKAIYLKYIVWYIESCEHFEYFISFNDRIFNIYGPLRGENNFITKANTLISNSFRFFVKYFIKFDKAYVIHHPLQVKKVLQFWFTYKMYFQNTYKMLI